MASWVIGSALIASLQPEQSQFSPDLSSRVRTYKLLSDRREKLEFSQRIDFDTLKSSFIIHSRLL